MDRIEQLIQSYHSGKPAVKAKALSLILRQPDRRFTPVLLEAFREEVNRPVIDALKRVADPELVSPLIALLDDPDPWRRAGACEVLGVLRDPAATLPLLARLRDPHPWTRVAAVRALAELKDPRAAEALRECYQEARGGDVNLVWGLEAALDALGVPYQRHALTSDGT